MKEGTPGPAHTIRPSTPEVLRLIGKLEDFVNESNYIPATQFYRSKVLLALISKALTTGRAVCALVDASFAGEAFGLSRTLVEIFFTVRHISNKDTEERARQYAEHIGKTMEEFLRVAEKHYPGKEISPLSNEFAELAKNYDSPHRWSSLRGQARAMAFEEDTYEVDEVTGNPIIQDFDYEFIYWQTSQFVHATIGSLIAHGVSREEPFRVRAHIDQEADRSVQALYNVLAFISKTFVCAFRGLQDDQPADILNEAMEVLSAFARWRAGQGTG